MIGMKVYRMGIPYVEILLGILLISRAGMCKDEIRVAGRITGKVTDAKTGKPLYGANILVLGTVLGAASDMGGQFFIHNLPVGTYDVEASMMGYKKEIKKEVPVLSGKDTQIAFQLEPTVLQQPALVVTASKRTQHLEDAPTSIDVVDKKDIQARNVTTLDEVLQNTAGVGIINGQINLRGSTGWNLAAGSRVLLMVDSHPLINGDTGGLDWDVIPVEEVERVEIVKGAGSALYGSNAMAGMVNILTRDPTPYPETRLRLSWGFYDEPAYPQWRWTDRFLTYKFFDLNHYDPRHTLSFENVDLSHSRSLGNVGILLKVGRKRSSGYMENGDYSRWNVLGKTKVHLGSNKTLTVMGNWALDNHGKFFEWASQESPMVVKSGKLGDRVRNEKANVYATFQHGINRKLAYTLKANVYRNNWQNLFHDDDSTYAITDRFGSEAQVYYSSGKHSLTFGSELTMHHTRSLIYGKHDTRDVALYAEDELKFSPVLIATWGTRYDYHSVVGISSDQQISPRAGLVFRPWNKNSLRFSVGHGFRAPSIAEVFAEYTYSGIKVESNLDLKKAERAWSFEFGTSQTWEGRLTKEFSTLSFGQNPFRWALEHLNPSFLLDVAFFWSQYKNMIDVEPNLETNTAKFMNLGRARIRGVETRLQASTFDRHLSATLGYTYIDPMDLDAQRTLYYRSRHRIVTSVEFRLGRFSFGWDYRYASRIEEVIPVLDSGYDERVPMHVMDGRILADLGGTQIGLEGKNLGNYHYTLRQRFLEPIRHFIVTLRTKF